MISFTHSPAQWLAFAVLLGVAGYLLGVKRGIAVQQAIQEALFAKATENFKRWRAEQLAVTRPPDRPPASVHLVPRPPFVVPPGPRIVLLYLDKHGNQIGRSAPVVAVEWNETSASEATPEPRSPS